MKKLALGVLGLAIVVTLVWARSADANSLQMQRIIRSEFGSGSLGVTMNCIARRESNFVPWAFNPRDHHSDGSWGSTGLFQIGTIWRNRGESPAHFIARMKNPWQNVRLAHWLYRIRGLRDWGGGCP